MSDVQPKKTKVCPYCSVPLTIDVTECSSCSRKVGKIDKHGMAEKPVNYGAYVICLLAWVGFYLYMRWAFF